ncbi:hypothetical protein [Aquimarina algiphila]|uniref:Lipocalin family protein n=1 Tax=Aquimarina algiphila TaxID=2047982 RepID=A0A554VFR3_9FLAO|nr:hypothetical protein [Aquimarina algiphila]TSE06089.1 hypothetical protein FOF46_20785 [Aquimarina algiphila]
MKRSQSITVISAVFLLTMSLTSFSGKQDNITVNTVETLEIQKSYGLIGTWTQEDNPETVLIFKSDFTVTEKSKDQTKENKWSVNEKSREVCIGNEKCIYFEATETALFLLVNEKRVKYNKSMNQ